MSKEFEDINGIIEQHLTSEQEKYRQRMGRDMSSIELFAYTAGIYEGFRLALDWAEKMDKE